MRGDLHRKLQRRRHHQAVHEVVLGNRNSVESKAVGKRRLRQHVLVDPVAAICLIGVIRR